MKYRGIFEYEYPTEHKPPVSIDVHLHGDCVKGKIIEWEYRPLEQEPKTISIKQLEEMYDKFQQKLWREHEDVRGDDMIEVGFAEQFLQELLMEFGCWDSEVEQ